ncbi:MAG: pilus assembly FimT family protein [Candidatus Komeilibacteria bacterium]
MNKKGFTLIELVVAMGVFLSLFLIVIVNFRSGESINELRLETQKIASDIRKVQTLSLTGSDYNNASVGVGGYGIMFKANNNDYVIFNDVNADGVYTLAADGAVLETRSLVPDINTLQITGTNDELHIVFKPYSSNVSIYTVLGSADPVLQSSTTSLSLTHSRATNKTGTVSITPVSGKVDFTLE